MLIIENKTRFTFLKTDQRGNKIILSYHVWSLIQFLYQIKLCKKKYNRIINEFLKSFSTVM